MSRTVLPAQHRFVLHSASGSVITGFILTASRTSVFQASQAQANMQRRYLLLLAFAALLVAAPLVRCQDDDEDVAEEFVETETAASPEAAGAAAGAGIADLATDYLNTATELGKQYVGQAAEVAQQYLGSYGDYLNPVLDKLGIKKSDKSEL